MARLAYRQLARSCGQAALLAVVLLLAAISTLYFFVLWPQVVASSPHRRAPREQTTSLCLPAARAAPAACAGPAGVGRSGRDPGQLCAVCGYGPRFDRAPARGGPWRACAPGAHPLCSSTRRRAGVPPGRPGRHALLRHLQEGQAASDAPLWHLQQVRSRACSRPPVTLQSRAARCAGACCSTCSTAYSSTTAWACATTATGCASSCTCSLAAAVRCAGCAGCSTPLLERSRPLRAGLCAGAAAGPAHAPAHSVCGVQGLISYQYLRQAEGAAQWAQQPFRGERPP